MTEVEKQASTRIIKESPAKKQEGDISPNMVSDSTLLPRTNWIASSYHLRASFKKPEESISLLV